MPLVRVYWVLNVDLVRSSQLQLRDEDRQRLYQVLENCFRFFLGNANIADSDYAWAGEGGFALVPCEMHSADDVLDVAHWFGRYAGHFLCSEYLKFQGVRLPQFRITIGIVNAAPASRLSNVAGRMLSVLLKYEREFGKAGYVTIMKEVYEQLRVTARDGFVERRIRRGGEQHTVFDRMIDSEVREWTRLTAMTLSGKDKIDKTTIKWLADGVQDSLDSTNSLVNILNTVFTPSELLAEITGKVHIALTESFPEDRFRVAYFRPEGDKLVPAAIAGPPPESGAISNPIPLDPRFTAALAYRNGESIFIGSTAAELQRSPEERRFDRLYPEQDIASLASLACLPVTSQRKNGVTGGPYAVLSIDTPTEEFFSENARKGLEGSLNAFLTEFTIGELLARLIDAYPDTEEKPALKKTKALAEENIGAEKERAADGG